MIYKDGKSGYTFIKRFSVTAVTRDKEYDLTAGNPNSKVMYFTANPNGEAEKVTILLRAVGTIKKLKWDVDFADLAVKGRSSRGNTVSKYTVRKIELKERGVSTLQPRKIWFDDTVERLNVDNRGELLGEFTAEDRLLIITQKGVARTIVPHLNTHFENDMIVLEKWLPNKPISVVYYDGDKQRYYVKRFMIDNPNKEEKFISDHPNSQLQIVAMDYRPMAEVIFSKRSLENIKINFEEYIAIKGIKALGNQLTSDKIKIINLLDPLPYEPPKISDLEIVGEEILDNGNSQDADSNLPEESPNDEDGQTTLF
jgi:topoisomerase-4 subunit A